MRLQNRSFTALCLMLFLGGAVLPAREGIPGRRVGGGTRISSSLELSQAMASSPALATSQNFDLITK